MSACFLGRYGSFSGSYGGLPGPAALRADSAGGAKNIFYDSISYRGILGCLIAAVYGLNCYLSVNPPAAGRALRAPCAAPL